MPKTERTLDRRKSNLLLLADVLGVRVESAALPDDLCGLYDDKRRLVILDERLNWRQEACTLRHELFHAQHHVAGSNPVSPTGSLGNITFPRLYFFLAVGYRHDSTR